MNYKEANWYCYESSHPSWSRGTNHLCKNEDSMIHWHLQHKNQVPLSYDTSCYGWHKGLFLACPNSCWFDVSCLTMQLYFWRAQLRPDARCVSKAKLLSCVMRYTEVADLPHQRLSTGLLVPMQDWAFLHRCLVLDWPSTSESIGPIDILHGTLSIEHSQSRSFNSLIKSIFVLLAIPFFNSPSLNFFQIEPARSSSFSCCATSLV